MDRRRFLIGSGLTLSTSVVGCLGNANPGTDDVNTDPRTETRATGTLDDGSETRLVAEWSRNDIPPYPIEHPGYEDRENWNPNYLGENMPTEPSLPFDRFPSSMNDAIREEALWNPDRGWSYIAELITNENELAQVVDVERLDSEDRQYIDTVDFDETILVLVGDFGGSGSIEHRWGRVESRENGVHLYGYLTQPWGGDGNYTRRYSLGKIDRPDSDVGLATVSFTVEKTTRLHFDSTSGTVSFTSAVIANDRDEAVTIDLRITTTEHEERVDETITVQGETEWKGIGLIGEDDTTFRVAVTIEALDTETTQTFHGTDRPLGIRVTRGGEINIGPSTER